MLRSLGRVLKEWLLRVRGFALSWTEHHGNAGLYPESHIDEAFQVLSHPQKAAELLEIHIKHL